MPYAVFLLPHGAPIRSPSLFCIKLFLRPLLTYASPGWFPFLSVINITKLERLHQAASHAISGCLLSSPIPLLLSEAPLPPLRVTSTHVARSSYERALRQVFPLKPAPFCKLLVGLGRTNMSDISLLSESRSVLFSIFSFTAITLADLEGTVFSLLLFCQATMDSWTLVSPRERHG